MRERCLAALVVVLLSGGCRNDWRTDMWYQPSIGAEEQPRAEPDHAVSIGAPAPVADLEAAEKLKDPIRADAASLTRGAWLFGERCSACHGQKGHGGGPVSRYFPPAPDVAYATVKARSDGYLWGVITFGGRAMPSQAEGLTVRDRWDLVNEIRALQNLITDGGTTLQGPPPDGGP